MRFTFVNQTGYQISVRGSNDITSDDLVLSPDAVMYDCGKKEYTVNILRKFVLIILIPYNNDYSLPIKAAALPTSTIKKNVYAEIGVNSGDDSIRIIKCDEPNVPTLPTEVKEGNIRAILSGRETDLVIGLGEYQIKADNNIQVNKNDVFYQVVPGDNGYEVVLINNIYSFMGSSRVNDPSDIYGFIIIIAVLLILSVALVFIVFLAKNKNR